MKIKFVLFIAFLVSIVSCQNRLNAQHAKPVKLYSTAQLDSLITDFFQIDGADIQYPETVIANKFQSHFPNAYDIEWETRNNLYSVDFEINKVDYLAVYDKQGNLLMYKFDIPRSAIPAEVKQSVSTHYKGMRVDDSEKIITGNDVQYKLEFEKGEYENTAIFNSNGTIVKRYPH